MGARTSGAPEGAGAAARTRRRVRGALLALIAVLYVASVPWYRGDGGELRLLFGLPDWVAVALGCYLAVAVLNCGAWLLTDVSDPPPADPRARDASTPGGPGPSSARGPGA